MMWRFVYLFWLLCSSTDFRVCCKVVDVENGVCGLVFICFVIFAFEDQYFVCLVKSFGVVGKVGVDMVLGYRYLVYELLSIRVVG